MNTAWRYLGFTAAGLVMVEALSAEPVEERRLAATEGSISADDRRPISARDLLQITDIGGYEGTISLSPDGEWVVYQTQRANLATNSYDISWYAVPATGHDVSRLVDSGREIILNSSGLGRVNGSRADIKAQWSPDSKRFAYLKHEKGEIQIWLSSTAGAPKQLTKSAADVGEFEWTPDSRQIIFKTSAPRIEASRADREEAKSGYLFDNRFFVEYARKPLAADCSEKLFMNYPRDEKRCTGRTWIVEIEGGVERRASTDEELLYATLKQGVPEQLAGRDARAVARSSDGTRLAWLENEDPKTFAGHAPPLRVFVSSPHRRCDLQACTGLRMERLWWSDDDREVVIQKREGVKHSRSAFYSWNPKTNRIRRMLVTEDKIFACDRSRGYLICLHEGWASPRKIVSLNLKGGSIRTLVDPNPDFKKILAPAVEKLELQDGFGNDVVAHVVYPLRYEKGRRYPAVIVQYRSRGFLRGGVGEEYPVPLFAANGFVVISFDRPDDDRISSRLADALEAERILWTDFYDKQSALNALDSILDGLDRRGFIDPARVGLTGLSDGAETVQYALIHSGRFAAAAASSTYWSPSVYFFAPTPWRKQIEVQFGRPYTSLERWRGISLSLNADTIDTPLLLQVSDQELTHTMEDYTALKAAGKPVEMFVFPDGYHIKWMPSQKHAVFRRSVQWMKFWLQGEEEGDPVDPEQYSRWRAMKQELQANREFQK